MAWEPQVLRDDELRSRKVVTYAFCIRTYYHAQRCVLCIGAGCHHWRGVGVHGSDRGRHAGHGPEPQACAHQHVRQPAHKPAQRGSAPKDSSHRGQRLCLQHLNNIRAQLCSACRSAVLPKPSSLCGSQRTFLADACFAVVVSPDRGHDDQAPGAPASCAHATCQRADHGFHRLPVRACAHEGPVPGRTALLRASRGAVSWPILHVLH